MLCLLHMITLADFSLNYDDLGLYQSSRAFQVGENYLFSSFSENALALVNASGEVIAEYRKSGQGPEELFQSSVIHIADQEIWMLTRKNHFTVFDYNLNFLRTEKAGPFKNRSFSYGHTHANRIRAFTTFSARTKFLMYEFEQTASGFRETDHAFLQKEIDQSRLPEALVITYHSGYFLKHASATSKDHYQIDVSQGPPQSKSDGDILFSLAAQVDGFLPAFPGSTTKAYINGAYKLDQGFAVSITARTEPFSKNRDFAHFIDFFDDQGGFLRREETEAALIGCFNCPDVFVVRAGSDGDRVEKLKSDPSGSP